jgi:acyl carrier protein
VTDSSALQQQVIALVSEALDVDPATVGPYSSLVDDLGAESIDFLDILFRVESAFSIKIPEDDLWRGSFESLDHPQSIADGVAALREGWPGFDWSRLPARITKQDLPRLITIQTIVEYLDRHGARAAGGAA